MRCNNLATRRKELSMSTLLVKIHKTINAIVPLIDFTCLIEKKDKKVMRGKEGLAVPGHYY